MPQSLGPCPTAVCAVRTSATISSGSHPTLQNQHLSVPWGQGTQETESGGKDFVGHGVLLWHRNINEPVIAHGKTGRSQSRVILLQYMSFTASGIFHCLKFVYILDKMIKNDNAVGSVHHELVQKWVKLSEIWKAQTIAKAWLSQILVVSLILCLKVDPF